jgi:CDGSH-type Zn-finger protein
LDQALIAARQPCAVEVQKGQVYWWCACGRSRSQPFCDGSHKVTTFKPIRFQAQRTERVWFCACKRSGHAPLCDGTHHKLPPA